MTHHRPVIFQESTIGQRHPVSGEFILDGSNSVRFEVGTHDSLLPLVIDPTIAFSTPGGRHG